jgi:hypothetical protein
LDAVDGDGDALFKRHGPYSPHPALPLGDAISMLPAYLVRWRVFQLQALVGQVPEVLVLGIVGLRADLERYVVRLGVAISSSRPLSSHAPRRDDRHRRREGLMVSSNRTWSLPLPVQPWTMASALLKRDLGDPLGDDGRAKEVPSRYFSSYFAPAFSVGKM